MENSDLKIALREGNVNSIEILIKSGINIEAPIGIHTPLTLVSELGYVSCVKTLIAHRANVNKRDFFDHTPLMRAAKHGHLECMKALIAANADINYQNHETYALFASANKGHVECVRLLINSGADVKMGLSILPVVLENIKFDDNLIKEIIERSTNVNNMKNDLGLSPLMIASQNGRTGCLELLLRDSDGIDDVSKSGKTALMYASSNGHVACAEKLIQAGADVNFVFSGLQPKEQRGNGQFITNWLNCSENFQESSKKVLRKTARTTQTSLMLASDKGHVECVLKLLEMGADVNQSTSDGVTALMCASKSGHLACVEALISAGADMNYKNDYFTPVLRAAKEGHSDCVKYLVDNGADWNWKTPTQSTLLHLLLNHGKTDEELVEILIRKGLDVNSKESDGKTPLMLAAQNGHIEILDLLLAKKVNVDDVNSLGDSALMLATMHGHIAAIQKLIEGGVDINLIGKFGSSALTVGCKFGQLDCVKMLINKGAVVNQSGKDDINIVQPLIISLQTNQIDCFCFLLENGANPNTIDSSGKTVLHIILEKNTCDFELFKKCVHHGADLSYADDKGMTLLMLAAKHGHVSTLNFLLENKTNLDKEDKRSWSAVKYAVSKGNDICLQNLLNAGANIVHKKKCVQSLINIAIQGNRVSCVRSIGEHLRKIKCIPQSNKYKLKKCSNEMLISLAEYGFISFSDLSLLMSFRDLVRARTSRSEMITFFRRGQKKTILTPLQAAFNEGDKGAIFFLLANLFLFEWDVYYIFSDFEFLQGIGLQTNLDGMKELRNQMTEQPWPLQTLSFITISSTMKPFIMNKDRNVAVDSLPLPDRFKKRLKFYDSIARLCPKDWSHILLESPGLDYLLKADTPNWLENKTVLCKSRSCCNRKGFRLKKFEHEFGDDIDSDTDSDENLDSEVRSPIPSDSDELSD